MPYSHGRVRLGLIQTIEALSRHVVLRGTQEALDTSCSGLGTDFVLLFVPLFRANSVLGELQLLSHELGDNCSLLLGSAITFLDEILLSRSMLGNQMSMLVGSHSS